MYTAVQYLAPVQKYPFPEAHVWDLPAGIGAPDAAHRRISRLCKQQVDVRYVLTLSCARTTKLSVVQIHTSKRKSSHITSIDLATNYNFTSGAMPTTTLQVHPQRYCPLPGQPSCLAATEEACQGGRAYAAPHTLPPEDLACSHLRRLWCSTRHTRPQAPPRAPAVVH